MNEYMEVAIAEARRGVELGEGGPFGAVIVRNGVVVGRGHNRVVVSHDPTAHAEINAIREASSFLGRYDLSDCEIYTTCEPCPMCYGAIYWAKIGTIQQGARKEDAAEIGFDDLEMYADMERPLEERNIIIRELDREACLAVFRDWRSRDDRVLY